MIHPFITKLRETYDTKNISIGIWGDVSFHNIKDPNNSLFASLINIFKKTDTIIMNLETVVSDKLLIPVKKGGTLAASPSCTAQILNEIGVSVALLANNHSDDYGMPGIYETITHVESAGIKTFGTKIKGELVIEKKGFKFQLCGFVTPYEMLTDCLMPYGKSLNDINHIEKNKDSMLLYFIHGFDELYSTPFPWRVNLLKKISQLNSPAALFCGHQHIYQGYINHNNVPVCLSYGNGFMHVDYHKINPDTKIGCYSVLHFDSAGCYQIDEYFYESTPKGVLPLSQSESLIVNEKIKKIADIADIEDVNKKNWIEESYKHYASHKYNTNTFLNLLYDLYRTYKLRKYFRYIHYRSMFLGYLRKRWISKC